jgi:hypothetical protein
MRNPESGGGTRFSGLAWIGSAPSDLYDESSDWDLVAIDRALVVLIFKNTANLFLRLRAKSPYDAPSFPA